MTEALEAKPRPSASAEAFERARRAVGERIAALRELEGLLETEGELERRVDDLDAAIAELRRATGFSKRRLVGAFRDEIGVPPKLYARLVRFQRASALLDAGAATLAEVALAAGYYDQPHMNAEFREFARLTPRRYLAARRPAGDTVVPPA